MQVQGTTNTTTTAKNGSFTLKGILWDKPVVIVAYAPFYKVGWVKLDPKDKEWKGVPKSIELMLKSLPEKDNFEYSWFSFEGVSGSASCELCHRENAEWNQDAHSQAAKNQRFLTLYKGKNIKGEVGQRTLYGSKGAALPPDPSKPYYGPGYKLDEPTRNGNCAACHTPMAAKIANEKNCGWAGCHTNLTSERATRNTMDAGVSPLDLTGDAAEGINCDFCHKVGDVILDPKTKLPKADMPGILSMRLFRPEDGDQVFFGPFGDVSRRVSYSPLQEKSEFCAPCHYGVFGGVFGDGQVTGGTLIYNSYGEGLDSPYSNPRTGKTCQECHMPVLDTKVSVFPEKGGIERDYVKLHNHLMPGAADEQLLQNSVTMKSQARRTGSKLDVVVSITNDQTGHHIPTDAPIRQMILVVQAFDSAGKPLALRQGPLLPDYSGSYAGWPGKSFAKVLKDEWTGEMPTAAYWRPVSIVEDTRLAAMATDTTRYSFDLPAGEVAKVQVRLVFRRAFAELAKQKGWNDPDILMEESTIQVEK
ncbi:MAG: hypothetical protein EHM21_18725 [Chloroflexi bacterium]|nr:MAG: hypothetical protein EHM21_18725 [Chloroflexota bacterium]